jgi:hypothetical protein
MSDDEKPPIAEVIDLASRRHERATLAGRTETILINPNSLKIKFGDDGGFTIQAEGVRRRAKGFEKVEWEVKAPVAQSIASRCQAAYGRTQRAAYYAAHPEQAPKPRKEPTYYRCGLTRKGKTGRSRETSCSRHRGHKGDHKDAAGAWAMPCPCPGSQTRVYLPGDGGMRVGYATCAWCGLRRDEQGRPMPTEVKP